MCILGISSESPKCARRGRQFLKALLAFLTSQTYNGHVKAVVTSKGQVTIPKPLRDQFGIGRGTQVDFVAAPDGIRVRKVVDRSKKAAVFGCLKKELAGRSIGELLDELRGPVELPASRLKLKRT